MCYNQLKILMRYKLQLLNEEGKKNSLSSSKKNRLKVEKAIKFDLRDVTTIRYILHKGRSFRLAT